MSAPVLGEYWQGRLRELDQGWDSYGGKPITAEAILTVESFAVVPSSSGGIQLEMHRDGIDIEIQIESDGKISSVLVGPTSR